LKLYRKICIISRKCGGRGAKINALVDIQICRWINIVLFQDKFEDHLGHAAFASPKNIGAFEVLPSEIIHGLSRNKEIAGPLCELGKIDDVIIGSLVVDIDGRLASHKSDIRFTGYQSSSHLVGAETGYQSQVDALLFKISVFNGHVLGGVKDRMCDLIQCHRSQVARRSVLLLPAAAWKNTERADKEQTNPFFHFLNSFAENYNVLYAKGGKEVLVLFGVFRIPFKQPEQPQINI